MTTICLDAGHVPGLDPGACGYGLKEADLTGLICQRTATALAAYDCDVRQVPRTDSLAARCDYANDIGAACFVSVHINAGGGTGFESYVHPYASPGSLTLREYLHAACMDYGAQHNVRDRGRKFKDLGVLRLTEMPAVLLELLFIDTVADVALFKNQLYLNGISKAITYGIAKAMGLGPRVPDETGATETAIARLQAKGVILSPAYWVQNARPGGSCKGEFVAALIRNFASKN